MGAIGDRDQMYAYWNRCRHSSVLDLETLRERYGNVTLKHLLARLRCSRCGAPLRSRTIYGRFHKTVETAPRAAPQHRDGSIRRGENARCNRAPTNVDECGLAERLSIKPLIVFLGRCRYRSGYCLWLWLWDHLRLWDRLRA